MMSTARLFALLLCLASIAAFGFAQQGALGAPTRGLGSDTQMHTVHRDTAADMQHAQQQRLQKLSSDTEQLYKLASELQNTVNGQGAGAADGKAVAERAKEIERLAKAVRGEAK